MAYSLDLRSRVIDFVQEGNTQESASKIFKVGTTTIKDWLKLLSETGNLEKKPLNRAAPKFDSEKLDTYIEENPNALIKDVAKHFNGSMSGAFYALERTKNTYKKRSLSTKKETMKNEKNSSKI